jgi:MFS transporter, DHA1 family, inner membrane transport protein
MGVLRTPSAKPPTAARKQFFSVMTTITTTPIETQRPTSHFVLAVLALAMGGFAIGTTEFVTMGLLPQIAAGVDVSIPTGGHVISAYALGVVIGAPVIAFFGARLPRRGLLVALMVAFAVGNAASALATSFGLLTLARVATGFPHGAYFGVASLVAASLAPAERKGRAVASVMLGLSVANVVGVPAATWLGQELGWRSAFWAVTALALLTVTLVLAFVPSCPGDGDATGRRELTAFARPQVWLTLLAGAVGFGGMFAVFSYVAPTVTQVGGLPDSAVPVFLLAFGLGMVAGTWLAGELADWSVFRSLLAASVGMGMVLLAFSALAPAGWWALPAAFLITAIGSVLVVNLQLRLMDVAGEAQTLGAAMNHASLNVANALGAWLGGVVIAAGFGYRATGLVGASLAAAGFVVLLVASTLDRRRRAETTRLGPADVRVGSDPLPE